jgi:hypothetical protein
MGRGRGGGGDAMWTRDLRGHHPLHGRGSLLCCLHHPLLTPDPPPGGPWRCCPTQAWGWQWQLRPQC